MMYIMQKCKKEVDHGPLGDPSARVFGVFLIVSLSFAVYTVLRNSGSKDSKMRKPRKMPGVEEQKRSDAYQKRRQQQSQPAQPPQQQAPPIRSIVLLEIECLRRSNGLVVDSRPNAVYVPSFEIRKRRR